jgi:Replicative DNA helicase
MQTITDRFSSIENDIRTAGYTDLHMEIVASHVSGLTTGFKTIDDWTGGLQRGELFVIAAPPLMGMTPFAISLINKVIQKKLGVAYFSIFSSEDQIIKKLLANYLRISMKDLLRGNINEKFDSVDQYPAGQLYIDDTPELTAKMIEEKMDSLIDCPSYIIIDDLIFFERHLNTSATDKILKTKGIARKYNIPVIVLYNTQDLPCEPELTQTQFIECQRKKVHSEIDSRLIDTLCTIYRPEYFGISEDEQGRSTLGTANFIILKHECGAGITTFNYKYEYSLFEEIKEK